MSKLACSSLFYHPGVRIPDVPTVLPYSSIAPYIIGDVVKSGGGIASQASGVIVSPFQRDAPVDEYVVEDFPSSAWEDSNTPVPRALPTLVRDASLECLQNELNKARLAAGENRTADAAGHYETVLNDLGRPGDFSNRTPTATAILETPGGDKKLFDLQADAMLGYASFAGSDGVNRILEDLHVLMPRLESHKEAIADRLKSIVELRWAVASDGQTKKLDDKGIRERLQACSDELGENSQELNRCEADVMRLRRERESLFEGLEPLRERAEIKGSLITMLEQRLIAAKKQIDKIKGLGKEARAERKRLHAAYEELNGQLPFLKGEHASALSACEPVQSRLADNECLMKAAHEMLNGLYAKRVAIYAEQDAIRARDEGDTDWTKVMESEQVKQEGLLYRVRLQEASVLMRFGFNSNGLAKGGINVRSVQLYREAEKIARSVLSDLYHLRDDRHSRLRLYAQLLMIESLAHQAAHLQRCGEYNEVKVVVGKLNAVANGVASEYEDGSLKWGRTELVAKHLADTAELLGRMGILDAALDHAHTVTSLESYKGARAAQQLLNSERFATYLNEDGTAILDANTVGEHASWWVKWAQRGQAMLAHNHYRTPFKERLIGGLAGVGTAMGIGYAATGDVPVLPAAAAAVAINTGIRLYNGWNTLQAQSAGAVGGADRPLMASAQDVVGLMMRGALGMAGWGFPAWMIASAAAPANWPVYKQAVTNIGTSWASVFGKLASTVSFSNLSGAGIGPLSALEIAQNALGGMAQTYVVGGALAFGAYAMMPHWRKTLNPVLPWFAPGAIMALSSVNSMHDICNLYMASAGLVYGGYTLSPQMRKSLQGYAKYFVPGAVMLGAHLGLGIKGQEPWSQAHFERLLMSSIAVGEGALMLMVTGAVPLPKMNSFKETFARMSGAYIPPSKNEVGFLSTMGKGLWYDANHMAMVAIAITVGVSAAVGGLMQKGLHPTSVPLIATVGALTTIGLLPMTLGISGILKQQIPLIERLRQAREDTEDWPFVAAKVERAKAAAQAFFFSMYTANRTIRSGTADVPWAALRTRIGYDSVPGYLAFVAGMTVTCNPATSKTFSEVAGTDWQLDPLTTLINRPEINESKLADHFQKSAQRLSPLHIWLYLDHRWKALKAMLSPLTAVRYVTNPPKFVLQRERQYLAQLYLYATGQTTEPNKMTVHMLRRLLAKLTEMSTNREYDETLHPIMHALYLARIYDGNSVRKRPDDSQYQEDPKVSLHRRIIDEWFADNPGLLKKFGLDPVTMRPIAPGTRRKQRSDMLKAIKEPASEYQSRVKAYTRSENPDLVAGLYR